MPTAEENPEVTGLRHLLHASSSLLLAAQLGCALPPPTSRPPVSAAPRTPRVPSKIQEGAPRIDVARYARELAQFKLELERPGADASACFNAGMAAYLCAEFDEAATLWEGCLQAAPGDWQLVERLIQVHQARADLEARERYRARLFELRQSAAIEALTNAPDYARDQFTVRDAVVQAFERFEPERSKGVVYVMPVYLAESSEPDYIFELGQNLVSTDYERERGSIPADGFVYDLVLLRRDGSKSERSTYRGLPTYDTVRDHVADSIIELVTK